MNCNCSWDDRGFPKIDVTTGDSSFDPFQNFHVNDKGFDPDTYHEITLSTNGDYNKLKNKPELDSVVLEGNVALSDLNIKHIYYDATANWNSRLDLISEEGAMYIYSDFSQEEINGHLVDVPGIKIGDGLAYVVDLPIVNSKLNNAAMTQIRDDIFEYLDGNDLLVSSSDRIRWDNKVTASINSTDSENLMLSF